ncbi:DNA processing protein [Natronincola peptidivorans]|uniref:DNA processing protein n=1 Tax=Natronincola peptidivorans TaxID=426128 RepID=A0A1H9ZIC9_9FIRM|nr:DNA-processing protein DprA [Natronincola peptidivorans]SES81329.1 DNA processing protein [Natronincola peptidivorans]
MVYWIWLRQLKGIGATIEKRLLKHFKTPQAIYEAEEDALMDVEGIGKATAKTIKKSRSLDKASNLLEVIRKKDIKILTYHDPLYPSDAKVYPEAPTVLYYKGNIRDNSEGVAIVGSRRCTGYGKQVAIEAADYLARNHIPVISGMAKGIDGYAHIACLKAGGYTIAFLGHGLDMCYPKEHIELMEGIIEKGVVISEYPPNTKPRQEYFPKRNALISSWSKKVLVVEAAEKSGALITANLAKAQGKEVLAPPHEMYSPTGRGTNRLIAQGATVYLHPSQLLEERESIQTKSLESKKYKGREVEKPFRELMPIEKQILDSFQGSIKTIEEIEEDTGISQVELIEHLSILELEGIIEALSAGRFKYTVPGT